MGNKIINQLMNKEMDRKDFLKYGGSILFAIIGISGLVNTLLKLNDESSNRSRTGTGYSGGEYNS